MLNLVEMFAGTFDGCIAVVASFLTSGVGSPLVSANGHGSCFVPRFELNPDPFDIAVSAQS